MALKLKRRKKTMIVPEKKSFLGKRKKKETLSLEEPNRCHKLASLMIFIEKIVIANAEADPIKVVKKNQYFFGVAAQQIWDTIPSGVLQEHRLYETCHEIYKFASQRPDVCVRALLNAGLVIADSLKSLIPQENNSVLGIETSLFRLLQEYDPDLSDDNSQKVGEDIANNILQYLEQSCTSQ